MKPRLTYLTCGSTLTVCGALVWLSFQEPHGPSRRLADGTTVELAQVTFGREHRHLAGNFWQRLWAGRNPNPLPTDQDEPVVWLHWRRPAVAAGVVVEYGPSFAVAAIDEHGCYLPNEASPSTAAIWGSSPAGIPQRSAPRRATTSCRMPVYPRRSGRFRFALLDQERPDPSTAAEFAVEVPPAPPVVEWEGKRSPVTARAGKAEFILTELRPERSQLGTGLSTAVFRFREAGKPSDNWHPEAVTVLDATGNTFRTVNTDYPISESLQFWGLCRREPAWKLRVRFVRNHPHLADAAFVWKPPPLPAPARLEALNLHHSARHGGVTLELTQLHGGSPNSTPLAFVSAIDPDTRFSLGLISVTDELGHSVAVYPPPLYALGREAEGHQFAFPYSHRARQLHLTFGLFETHTVEFLVKPP